MLKRQPLMSLPENFSPEPQDEPMKDAHEDHDFFVLDNALRELPCGWSGCSVTCGSYSLLLRHIHVKHVLPAAPAGRIKSSTRTSRNLTCRYKSCRSDASSLMSHVVDTHLVSLRLQCPIEDCLRPHSKPTLLFNHLNEAHSAAMFGASSAQLRRQSSSAPREQLTVLPMSRLLAPTVSPAIRNPQRRLIAPTDANTTTSAANRRNQAVQYDLDDSELPAARSYQVRRVRFGDSGKAKARDPFWAIRAEAAGTPFSTTPHFATLKPDLSQSVLFPAFKAKFAKEYDGDLDADEPESESEPEEKPPPEKPSRKKKRDSRQ